MKCPSGDSSMPLLASAVTPASVTAVASHFVTKSAQFGNHNEISLIDVADSISNVLYTKSAAPAIALPLQHTMQDAGPSMYMSQSQPKVEEYISSWLGVASVLLDDYRLLWFPHALLGVIRWLSDHKGEDAYKEAGCIWRMITKYKEQEGEFADFISFIAIRLFRDSGIASRHEPPGMPVLSNDALAEHAYGEVSLLRLFDL